MYAGKEKITAEDLRNYELYSPENFRKMDSEEQERWLRAPIIVKNNRERVTINFYRALEYAEKTGAYLFRWQGKCSRWEGKPKYNDIDGVMQDPAFWEIFVAGGPCYLNETISKTRRLCNGTRGKYHSMVLSDDNYKEFKFQSQNGKTVITLSSEPVGINVLIEDENVIKPINWKGFKNYDTKKTKGETIIVPIKSTQFQNGTKPMPIVPENVLLQPCRVKIGFIFPIQPGFAITVDKAQGQTLERVIVALSERDHKISNFTYACVYVAMSRVKLAQHLQILLKKDSNPWKSWQTLMYVDNLRKEASIDAFFDGFNANRSDWKNDEWNAHKALTYYFNKS